MVLCQSTSAAATRGRDWLSERGGRSDRAVSAVAVVVGARCTHTGDARTAVSEGGCSRGEQCPRQRLDAD